MAPLDDFDNIFEQMEQDGIREVCIWAGDNASEWTFLEMICHSMRLFKGTVKWVGATALAPLPYIGLQTPAAFAALFDERNIVDCSKIVM